MSTHRSILAVVVFATVWAAVHLASPSDSLAPIPPGPSPRVLQDGSVQGMTVSCPTWGWEWGSDAMVETLHELAGMGVNWVAIHPYGGIRNDGSVDFRPVDPQAPPAWLARPIAEAHALGMKILIKPHIAYWGSRWSWRGAIELESEAARTRFFHDYTEWIGQLAAASRGADAFAVGTELDKTLQYEVEWRAVIASVRRGYEGPITYAANWTDYQRVPFWDAVDVIGVQAYFPIVKGVGADNGLPSEAQLDAGWAGVMKEIAAVSARHDRPVVFTELGYNRSSKAAAEPWKYETGGPGAADVQSRCLTAAIRAMDREPAVLGAFLWKWFPGASQPLDFSKSEPHMRNVIETHWGARAR